MALAVGDESFEATEPAFDAPPRFGEVNERRLHARAYNHWATLQRGRCFPRVDELDLAALGGLAANSVLIDVGVGVGIGVDVSAGGGCRLRFVGERLRDQVGGSADRASGEQDVEPLPGSLVDRLIARIPELLAARAPVGFADELATSRGTELLCRGILMPLSSDGAAIDVVHGVVNWKEVLSPELTQGLAAEIGAEVRLARAARAIDPFA